MRRKLTAAILVVAGMPAFGHRLDEYLQGTILSVQKGRLQAQITLTPGVIVFPFLISSIDINVDGVISETEQRSYAGRVLRDLSLTIDGQRLTPQLRSMRFPTVDEMKEGRGEIQIDFNADLPPGGRNRELILENHHQSRIAAYQVNCLVPSDPDIRITAQTRNYTQSFYRLEYEQANLRSASLSLALWPGRLGWLGTIALLTIALLLLTRLAFLWRKREAI